MSTKKPRKSLEDTLAEQFVYGEKKTDSLKNEEPDLPDTQKVNQILNKTQEEMTLKEKPLPTKEQIDSSTERKMEFNLMTRLQTPPKEATIRFTIDLSESMHRRLSIMAAKMGRKKADIVRVLLEEAMKDVKE